MRRTAFAAVTYVLAGATWLRGVWEDFLILLPPTKPLQKGQGSAQENTS